MYVIKHNRIYILVNIPSNLRTSQHLTSNYVFIPSLIPLPTEITIVLNFLFIFPFKNSFCI